MADIASAPDAGGQRAWWWTEYAQRSMGGHLGIRVTWPEKISKSQDDLATRLLRDVASRVDRWAAMMTRHHASQLTRINAEPGTKVRVGPTLAAVLSWSADAWSMTDGLINIAMLDERIAAEEGRPVRGQSLSRDWQLQLDHWTHEAHAHIRGGWLTRPDGLQLDLDGVGKGWIADRAATLLMRLLDAHASMRRLPGWHSCFVDADGDIAIRNRRGADTLIRIEVPGGSDPTIGTIRVSGAEAGVATSGTGIHAWGGRHHIIDPRTGRSANSGIAQATVVTASTREAEAWAKAIVIDGARMIQRAETAGVHRVVAVEVGGGIISAPAFQRADAPHQYLPSTDTAAAPEMSRQ